MAPGKTRTPGADSSHRGVQKIIAKSETCYVRSLKRLVAQLELEKAGLEHAKQQREWELERQKILVDFILCQEELERILGAQAQLLANVEGLQQAELEQISASAAASGNNWSNRLLASASLWCIQVVKRMTVEDWLAASNESFGQITVLLELSNRQLALWADSSVDVDSTGCKASEQSGTIEVTAAAATMEGQEQDLAAAAAAVEVEALPSFEQVVQKILTPILVSMFYNPQPYYASAACNQATGKVQMAPPTHIQHVVHRLRLSRKQLLHLRIANSEFARLSRAASSVGDMLAERAARLSLSAVAEEYQSDRATASNVCVDSGQDGTPPAAAAPAAAATAAAAAPAAGAAAAAPQAEATIGQGLQASAVHDQSSVDGLANKRRSSMSANLSADRNAGKATDAASITTAAVASGAAVDQQHTGVEEEDGASPAEALSQQLDRYLSKMNIHTCVTAWLVLNTLTLRQLLTFSVASYPFVGNVHAIAEACMSYQPPNTATTPGERRQHANTDQPAFLAQWEQGWDREADEHMAKREEQLQAQLKTWMSAFGLS